MILPLWVASITYATLLREQHNKTRQDAQRQKSHSFVSHFAEVEIFTPN
jgi:hypothetical protein